MNKIKTFLSSLIKKDGTKTLVTSLWCALLGLILGFVILVLINPNSAGDGMSCILCNFLMFNNPADKLNYFGQTLAKTAPLIMISLSIIVSYKAGLFNLGASGQYTMAVVVVLLLGVGANFPWWIVMILAMIVGAIYSCISGLLKAYFNVNEIISGIMLNWIALYFANGVLSCNNKVWNASNSESFRILSNSNAALPTLGLDKLFSGNSIVGIAIILAPILAIIIYILLNKTTIGYELKATGFNKDAANYSGMNKIKNIIIASAISGGLAGLAASFNFQNGFSTWMISSTTPTIGFDGISAAFLGGLNPIGSILSSFFITSISEGGSMITDLGFAPEVANIITSTIIYLSGFVGFIKEYIQKSEIKSEINKLNRVKDGNK